MRSRHRLQPPAETRCRSAREQRRTLTAHSRPKRYDVLAGIELAGDRRRLLFAREPESIGRRFLIRASLSWLGRTAEAVSSWAVRSLVLQTARALGRCAHCAVFAQRRDGSDRVAWSGSASVRLGEALRLACAELLSPAAYEQIGSAPPAAGIPGAARCSE